MPSRAVAALLLTAAGVAAAEDSGREKVARRWWESAAAIVRVSLKPGRMGRQFPLQPDKAGPLLDALKAQGVGAIEIFAPAEGGLSYSGLDTINRYRIEPELGTMEDFRALVRLIHDKGMAAISFDNLGYSSVEAVEFLKACDDVKAGRDSREARFFLWSDSADAPPPGAARGDTFFMVRPTHLPGSQPGTFYDSTKHEIWAYSERAGKYYWSKWGGTDRQGNRVRLPQYNWASPEFQEEAEKIVRFWMDTGLDGVIIDAVNWYVDYTWAKGRRRVTDVIASYGNTYSQPEGAGGFHEDPVAWITEGGWNSVQDYGLGIWWEKDSNVLQEAIETGDPRPIERALRNYHDRVVAVGGTLYCSPPKLEDRRKANLALALVAAAGDLVAMGGGRYAGLTDAEQSRILRIKQDHPALHQLGRRQALRTDADDKHYAFLRIARNGGERMLVVTNFQPAAEAVDVDLSGVDFETMIDLDGGAVVKRQSPWRVELPAYGYHFYRLSRAQGPAKRRR